MIWDGVTERRGDQWRRQLYDRITNHDERIETIEGRLKEGDHRMENLAYADRLIYQQLTSISAAIERIEKNTSPVAETYRDITGTTKVGEFVAKTILLLGGVAGAIAAAYHFVTTGKWPLQ